MTVVIRSSVVARRPLVLNLGDDPCIPYGRVPHARKDVYSVDFISGGRRILGYVLSGGEGTVTALVTSRGRIVGWESSYCHEPAAYYLRRGRFEPMPPEVRAGLRVETMHQGLYRIVWSELVTLPGQRGHFVPGGRIVALYKTDLPSLHFLEP